MSEFGLLGENLGYSYSKKIHESYGLYDYELFERKPEELEDFFNNRTWKGINVTIPYKRKVQRYCDEETQIAQRVGAINTIFERDGKLIGDNTDYYGFIHTLNLVRAKTNGKKVLVLGRGGAAKCVREAMKDRHAGTIWQTAKHELGDLSKMADAEIVVNATPVGTAGTGFEGKSPCDLSQFKRLELVIDLVYNPEETPLLKQARELGVQCIGGMEMLKFQAEKAAHRFMGCKNIILIGMPGCGKSHIGRVLAHKTGRQFLDTDGELKKETGLYSEELIKTRGIEDFRRLECEALSKLLNAENAVISTGGGIVTWEDSYRLLESSGKEKAKPIILWIDRDIELLGTKNRPLSKNLDQLYDERAPLYEALADLIVDNNGNPDDCVSYIKRMCKI